MILVFYVHCLIESSLVSEIHAIITGGPDHIYSETEAWKD